MNGSRRQEYCSLTVSGFALRLPIAFNPASLGDWAEAGGARATGQGTDSSNDFNGLRRTAVLRMQQDTVGLIPPLPRIDQLSSLFIPGDRGGSGGIAMLFASPLSRTERTIRFYFLEDCFRPRKAILR
jgi:hypothetical protein